MMASYLNHFGLTHLPLGKSTTQLWDSKALSEMSTRFQWLLDSPGVGVLTGEPGVGKTAALRHLCQSLDPHQYQVIYHCETDFGRIDLYRQLAIDFGLEPVYRRAEMWRMLKQHIQNLHETQHRLPVWIIDEAQNLTTDFFRDFPSFINFAFDSKPLMTIWFVGHTSLESLLKRNVYSALHSRVQLFLKFEPLDDPDEFKKMIMLAFNNAGATSTMVTDTGLNLIRLASHGRFRQAGQIINVALQLGAKQNLNHLPDNLIEQSIKELQR